jgi:hypothetical protein
MNFAVARCVAGASDNKIKTIFARVKTALLGEAKLFATTYMGEVRWGVCTHRGSIDYGSRRLSSIKMYSRTPPLARRLGLNMLKRQRRLARCVLHLVGQVAKLPDVDRCEWKVSGSFAT